MSLVFAAITPHPPIIIPAVGKHETNLAFLTVNAMKKLANIFNEAEVDTLIIISPHSLIYSDRFNICGMEKLFGTFGQFDAPEVMLEARGNLDLATRIEEAAEKENLRTLIYDNNSEFFELDHGTMVPLYYLKNNAESSFRVLNIAYSNLSRADHFTFGQVLQDAIENSPERIGIIASGDLSHRLMRGNETEIEAGKNFDNALVDDIKNNKLEDIVYYEDSFIEAAGECGYRSILVLLGALDRKNVVPEVLSYEGPFGVGYLVANFKLKGE